MARQHSLINRTNRPIYYFDFASICERCVALILILAVSNSLAADPEHLPDQTSALAAKLADAMQAEVDGDFLSRQRLLAESLEFSPTRWQTGHILDDGQWLSIEDSIATADQNPELRQYERRRAVLTDTLKNHFALARWCANRGLTDQCRSHLNRVLEFDPDNLTARRGLGYQLVNGRWMSLSEQVEVLRQTQLAINSQRQYATIVRSIYNDLNSNSPENAEAAEARLKTIDDPAAVPTVESVFSNSNQILASYALDWLGQVDCTEATQSLARFALSHPMETVRRRAAERLTDRPLFDFVPDLLKMLESPVAMMLIPSFDRQGNLLGYRQAFAKERIDKTEFRVLDRFFEWQNTGEPSRRRFDRRRLSPTALISDAIQEDALQQFATGEVLARRRSVQQENLLTINRNARVADVLSQVAGREFAANPKPLWDWWDEYCETEYQREKPLDYRRTLLVDRIVRYPEPPPPSNWRSHECFVAGTEVMTERGLKPIEQIVVGDRVLSKHTQTAELSWKPVLRSTTRPALKTLKLKTDEGELICTSGHLFWVSGRGWQKASELESGDVLHAARRPSIVLAVSAGPVEETYNLQVADNSTYFVGEELVLTHDVTRRTAERQRIPGEQWIARMAAVSEPN